MKSVLFLVLGLLSSYIKPTSAIPVAQQQHCPVIKESDLDSTLSPAALGSKVIRMDEVDGNKLRLQFYYPSIHRRRQVESGEGSTTLGSPQLDTETTTGLDSDDGPTTLVPQLDIFCQWDFRAGNESQFLLLTFEKLSAPYSDNCEEAFVAMQKENGYESRWCGNRRQVQNKIFGFLPEPEIRKLRRVCKFWNFYFRNAVGLRLVITNTNDQTLADLVGRDRKFAALKISNVTATLGSIVPWDPPMVYLTRLSFHRIVATRNIFWALKRFKCLQRLEFNHILLDLPAEKINTKIFNLPYLRSITLYSKTGNGHGTTASDLTKITNLDDFPPDEEYILSFLAIISCERLTALNLFCSEELLASQPIQELFDGRHFSHCTSPFVKLVSKNRMSLQTLLAGQGTNRITLAWRFRPGDILWQTGMQLTYCESYLPTPPDWTLMFPVQRNLNFIRVNEAYKHWTSLIVGIKKSHKTITEIRLAGGGHGSSVDLERFGKCSKLVWLDILLDECYLQNVQCLPVSLRHLYLNGPLTEDDLQAISVKLENLEYFYLDRNLPSYEYKVYGDQFVLPATITKKVLKGFLTLPKIYSLTFRDTRMQVVKVGIWLSTIPGIEVDLLPVEGYSDDSYGSLKVAIPMRRVL